MPHILIAGITESGKTTLAKKMASMSRIRGRGVLVLDPMHDDWDADYQTDSETDFLEIFWRSKSCDAYIDEAADYAGRYDDAIIQTATRGRHWGHSVHYISQRPAQLSPTVRSQCRHLFCFAVARDDAEKLAKDWNKPELKEAADLPQGCCIHAQRFKATRRINVFNEV